jgi:AcrR family transcriptional regulator
VYQYTSLVVFRFAAYAPATVTTVEATARPRGRRPAASREDVLAAALRRFSGGERVDVRALAAELGLGRTTIYRWFRSREGLLGEVVVRASEPVFEHALAGAKGRGGAKLLDVFDRINRALATAPALRRFLELERDAPRILTSSAGIVQPAMVERVTAIIDGEVRAGRYRPPVEPATLGYAIVRLAEAFLYNDGSIRGDVERLREVEAALLGVS